jgi:hypothetical protein
LSLTLLWCVEPVQRSIARTRNVVAGTLLGIGKVLIPMTGIVLFLLRLEKQPRGPAESQARADSFARNGFLLNLIGLVGDLGQLILMILINGARIPQAAGPDHFGQSISGEMSPLKRDSVVLIFVLALHVLCGVVLAKA